jgi:hypothetical protein
METLNPAHIVAINGTAVAFGVHWRALPQLPGYEPEDSIAKMLATYRARYGILISSAGRAVVGVLPPKTKGAGSQVHSAAAVLSAAPRNAIYALRLDEERVWIFRGGAGQITLDSDNIVSLDEANDFIDTTATNIVSSGKSAPPIIITPDLQFATPYAAAATRTDLPTLFAAVSDATVLRVYGSTSSSRKLLYGAVALVALYAGGTYVHDLWDAHQRAIAQLAEQQNIAPENRGNETALRQAAEAQAISQALAADTAGPDPWAFTQACRDLYRVIGHHVAGWSVRTYHCDPGASAAVIGVAIGHPATPDFGTPRSITEFATTLGGTASIDASLVAGSVTIPLALVQRAPVSTPAALPSYASFVNGEGTTLLGHRRGDPRLQFSLTAPAPRPITYADPVPLQPGQAPPPQLTVAPERSYSTVTATFSAPHPWNPPIQLFAHQAHVRAGAIDITPAGSNDTTVSTLTLVFRP